METEEWGEWIEWKGGECPIPEVKAGEYEMKSAPGGLGCPDDRARYVSLRRNAADPVIAGCWTHKIGCWPVVAYRLRKPAEPDWKADMLAAWRAGELEFNMSDDETPAWTRWTNGVPSFGFPQSDYRRRQKPAEPAEVLAAVPQPKSDLPGIAEYQKWKAAQPAPAPVPQPESKRCDGLGVMAPMSGRVGGKWGL